MKDHCSRTPECKGTDVWKTVAGVAESLRRSPRTVKPARLPNGGPDSLSLDATMLAAVLSSQSAVSRTEAGKPTIQAAQLGAVLDAAKGDWRALEAFVAAMFTEGADPTGNPASGTAYTGLNLSVT